jgi:hypothetical protein
VALFPFPPFVEVTAWDVFTYVPPLGAVTFTLTSQVLPTSIAAPLKVSVVALAAGINEALPQSVEIEEAGVAATLTPSGKLSTKPTPVRAAEFDNGFRISKVKVEVPFARIEPELKTFVICGGATTVNEAVEILLVPDDAVTVTEFGYTIEEAPVTLATTVQEPLAASAPPLSASMPLVLSQLTDPPH